jgi:hypothetical protein
MASREFAQQINIPCHQIIFGDNADRIPEFSQNSQASPCQLQPALNGLMAVGHATHGDDLRFPFGLRKLAPQQLGRVFLHHDAGLEIQPGGKAEILMKWPGVTVGTLKKCSPSGSSGISGLIVWTDT